MDKSEAFREGDGPSREVRNAGHEDPERMKWKVLSQRTIIKDRWADLVADTCMLPDHTIIEPFYVYRMPDFVVVAAITEDGEMVLIRQYRHGVRKVLLELPAGMIEPGEEPETAARRELLEETGYQGEQLEFLFKVAPNASNCNNYAYCYLARNVVKTAQQKLDPTEDLEIIGLPCSEAEKILRDGGFEQAVHVAMLYRVLEILR